MHLHPDIFLPEPVEILEAQQSTWGLLETRVDICSFTGQGAKVAVLDTGMDLNHPDFQGRTIKARSFVPDETVDDINGHGTHCIGTACGFEDNENKRYGVAGNSDIYVGKVLGGKEGRGADSWIINAINWAINMDCDVVSMSLSAPVYPRQAYKRAYERTAQYALQNNTLLIAAAGNDSRRNYGIINPVGGPANCPSIMTVGAIDRNNQIASFSNGSINPDGQVDIAGPGVDVYSSYPANKGRYTVLSGTSMATPHVSGITALYKEKFANASALQLWQFLTSQARRLNLASSDVGAGLVQAPKNSDR
ncbi:Intracellular serine protease [subsurface metagenome]